jgi:hypothetical protein
MTRWRYRNINVEGGNIVQKTDERQIKTAMLEILHLERKNLRSKAMTDQKMVEEIKHIIVETSRIGM